MKTRMVLEIEDLTVAYRHGEEWLPAVRDFALSIPAGATYGLVGESGSGKSTVALAIMRYLAREGRVESGIVRFAEKDLLASSRADMVRIWGRRIAMVPQNPQSSLNPSMRVGNQISEILRRHDKLSRDDARERSLTLLKMVRVADPERVADSYPHEISGGMQQRALIAMALSTEPELLILDEPTTSLDVTTQAAVLDLLRDLIRERQTAALYVTHNLGVVARICERVAVLYAGELVEDAATSELYSRPLHPYTQGLLDSVPRLGQHKLAVELRAIPGQIPALGRLPEGCVFAPRCPISIERCHDERPPLENPEGSRTVRCFRWRDIATGEAIPRFEPPAIAQYASDDSPQPLLEVDALRVYFAAGRSLGDTIRRRPEGKVKAVDGVTLYAGHGQTLGIVGESGSGKSTLARAILGLAPPESGRVELMGLEMPATLAQRGPELLRHLQYIFQNPEEALNPHMTVGETLQRPQITLLGRSASDASVEVARLLAAVRLPPEFAERFPQQLSGGEKQRVAIARAFSANPELVIADEAVSALDVSVQASILNLMYELQLKNETTLIFISHDLAVVGYLADKIAVMYLGQVMELSPAQTLFEPPFHPYAEALLSAIPSIDPQNERERIRLVGDIPSNIDVPDGCPFHQRCPRFLGDICRDSRPPWQELGDGKRIFCHIPVSELTSDQAQAVIPGVT